MSKKKPITKPTRARDRLKIEKPEIPRSPLVRYEVSLTLDEARKLAELGKRAGARSVSDFIRSVVTAL